MLIVLLGRSSPATTGRLLSYKKKTLRYMLIPVIQDMDISSEEARIDYVRSPYLMLSQLTNP